MKFNWGTGIVIFIILFVTGMGVMVFIAFQQDINLVHKDYYPKGIDHQTMIEKVNRTNKLTGEMNVSINNNLIEVAFPEDFRFDEIEGDILLYRPSDFNEDLVYPIKLTDDGVQQVSIEGLIKGKYIVMVEWSHDGTDYYFEESIHIE